MPATGCCGMAGSVGFEAGERYDVHDTAEEGIWTRFSGLRMTGLLFASSQPW